VDALFDNGKRGRVLRGANNRPLKSLSDTLKGKQGRFRQNLLGKRVDYSGRSVIVIGPDLNLDQCGLPKKMALELFKPFIYHRLERDGHVQTIKAAKEMVEQQVDIVWDILEEVIKEHPVMLNRAPTLHRLGIQAFMPVLVEGKAIKIHPLVCTAFNADFDGDQMAVHVPLSPIAQIEANVLMKSTNNLLSPANGKPIAVPSQDIVLGCYYLTKSRDGSQNAYKSFTSEEDVILAYELGEVDILDPIKIQFTGEVINLELYHNSQDVEYTEIDTYDAQILYTTVGRVILNDYLPKGLPFINGLLKRNGLRSLVNFCQINYSLQMTVHLLDSLKEIGFLWAMKAGISIGIKDMVIPDAKQELVESTRKDMLRVEKQYLEGSITNGERYNKIINLWSNVTDRVADEMFKDMLAREERSGEFNSIYIMADSGARGSKQQIRQLAGMRGLMAKPSGEILETPITSNFREGLTVLQYFNSTHGARKGLADTALKTADSGYLTRRLVDVSQDVIVTEIDCGTLQGIGAKPIVESGEIIEHLRDRIIGRVALEDIRDPYSNEIILPKNEEITEDYARKIEDSGIEKVMIRSVLTCRTKRGVCARCYGRNLATGKMVELGEAVGVIAAQSIGEPGTQLTMRTFHIGGTASRVGQQSVLEARNPGTVKFINLRTVRNKAGDLVVMNRNGVIAIEDVEGRERERYRVVYGAILKVNEGDHVQKGNTLVEWDPYTMAILTEQTGKVIYKDIVPNITMAEDLDEVSGLQQKIIIDSPDERMQPTIAIVDEKGKELVKYLMPSGAYLMVGDGDPVFSGDILVKIPRATTKTKDITGGLPRVVELFEARKPKEPSVIAEIDGMVNIGEVKRGYRRITVENDNGVQQEYKIPRGTHINVRDGERVKAGEPLIDGPINPHDILDVKGIEELQDYLVNEVQEVYRLQGVNINDKHIEVICRQMLRWVKVEEVGDTTFIVGEKVDKFVFEEENDRVTTEGGQPATGKSLLQGITKASLSTDSFFSAAAFQETTRVLTEASVEGAIDFLRGCKENVLLGRLIPAGTGLPEYRNIEIEEDKAEELFDRLLESEMEELVEKEESDAAQEGNSEA
jgi:DNA-directed RNA polymerase subunit beta'